MDKAELIKWLIAEQNLWHSLLAQIDDTQMENPGVNGDWSVKDIIVHLTTWHIDHVLCLGAAVQGKAPPDPPWPMELEDTNKINAWIYELSRNQTLEDSLVKNEQVFHDLMSIVQSFAEDIQIEIEDQFRVVVIGEQRFSVGYFFDHLHEEHKAQIQAWIAKNRA